MKYSLTNFESARQILSGITTLTPFEVLDNFSDVLGCRVVAKREDLQVVRSYKIRGAYHKIARLGAAERMPGVICASAGNHAQGVAYACNKLNIPSTIYMPVTTPKQKVQQVRRYGNGQVEIILTGDTFDEAYTVALDTSQRSGIPFVHPFNDDDIISGQGTVALEMLEQYSDPIDYLLLPVGGGGLASGVGQVFKALSPGTKIIGLEPEGAPAMHESFRQGQVVTLDSIDSFTDGAAVRQVGNLTYKICREVLDEVVLVPEGLICQTLLQLYNENAIVAEPAGALALAGAVLLQQGLRGKTVAVVISGGNNDITRFPEIRERALLYRKLKHYFIVRFPQRPGALKQFVADVLGPDDDIVHFEYHKKTSRERGPALVGIELKNPGDLQPLLHRMKEQGFLSEYVNDRVELMAYLV